MAITISGSGITSANIADGTIVDADVADVAASKLTGALPAIDGSALTNLPGGGKVLQVINAVVSTVTSTSSTSYVDVAGFTQTITPTSATSKILVSWNICHGIDNHSSHYGVAQFKLVRGSTDVFENVISSDYGQWQNTSIPFVYLDSPATTSSITYKVQVKILGSIRPLSFNNAYNQSAGTSKSTLTIMEIGV